MRCVYLLCFCCVYICANSSDSWADDQRRDRSLSKKVNHSKRVAVLGWASKKSAPLVLRKKTLKRRARRRLQEEREGTSSIDSRVGEGSRKSTVGLREREQGRSVVVGGSWGVPWSAVPLERLLRYASELCELQMPRQAVRFLERLSINRYHPRVMMMLGKAYQKARMWRQARATFLLVKQMEKKSHWIALALLGVGVSHVGMHKWELAKFTFFQILTLFPKETAAAGARLRLGELLLSRGQWREAIAHFRKGGFGYPGNRWGAKCLMSLGRVLIEKKRDHFEAIKIYLHMANHFPKFKGTAYWSIAGVYDRLNSLQHALRFYRRMVQVSPAHEKATLANDRIRVLTGG